MPKPITHVTPDDRVDKWKKMWATPKLLDGPATDAAFEEFQEAFVPKHMHKQFLKFFGTPKAKFGNRFFFEDAVYTDWDTRLSALWNSEDSHVEATVIYGSPDKLEAHTLRGEQRRSLKDIVIDDWHAACAIVRSSSAELYVFVEPKMRGCIIRLVKKESADT